MKLKELTSKLAFLSTLEQPILFLDNDDTTFMLKYRHTKDLPLGFYDCFNHELEKHMDEILDLDVVFSCDKVTTFNLYVYGLKKLYYKIQYGGKE